MFNNGEAYVNHWTTIRHRDGNKCGYNPWLWHIFLCLFLHLLNFFVCGICVCTYLETHIYARVCRGQSLMPDVFLGHSLPCEARTPQVSQLVNQWDPRICLSLPPQAGSQAPPLCLALECLGSKLSSPLLHNTRLTHWVTFLVPFFRTLSLFRSPIVQSVIDCLLWSLKGEGTVRAEWELALYISRSCRALVDSWCLIKNVLNREGRQAAVIQESDRILFLVGARTRGSQH